MARLYEHQGKALLAARGVKVPRGRVARSAAEARAAAEELGGAVVVKAQAWVTNRRRAGGVVFAATAEEAAAAAGRLVGSVMGGFPVEAVLVEERLAVARELYAGVIVDDGAGAPVVIVSARGGTGIEEVAQAHPEAVTRAVVDVRRGLERNDAANLLRRVGVHGAVQAQAARAVAALYETARAVEARSAEVNPLVVTTDGAVVAADCRVTVDDYAVFRHPELGIDFARELGHPPTPLDRLAYAIEAGDYRGTFYFVQLVGDARSVPRDPRDQRTSEARPPLVGAGGEIEPTKSADRVRLLRPPRGEGDRPVENRRGARNADPRNAAGHPGHTQDGDRYVGFHGFGGGGSMMSMDALAPFGLRPANFCDTSGNPPASKVYRAARIILAQPGIVGYFLSGSGVASQEQFHSARGVAKAFRDVNLAIPAVLRLGGNQEEKAIAIIARFCADLPARVEAYGKAQTPGDCAARLDALLREPPPPGPGVAARSAAAATAPYRFGTVTGGTITYDHDVCLTCASKACVTECIPQILKVEDERPVLAIPAAAAAAGRCTECLACEFACLEKGAGGATIDLPIAWPEGVPWRS